MIESIIESLARSGRSVRIKELAIGYLDPLRTLLSGAAAGLLIAWGRYVVYAAMALWAKLLSYTASYRLVVHPPELRLFPYGAWPTLAIVACGAVLALLRRWSIRRGRFLLLDIGSIVQFRAGWHVPAGVALLGGAFFVAQRPALAALPHEVAYFLAALAALILPVVWEVVHDGLVWLVLNRSEKDRAAIEFDLKEAIAQDQGAERYRVERVRFDTQTRRAVLIGEFSTPAAAARAGAVARKVRGVSDVELVELSRPAQPPERLTPAAGRRPE